MGATQMGKLTCREVSSGPGTFSPSPPGRRGHDRNGASLVWR